MPLELKQSSPAISDSALRLQGEPPPLPADVLERFPSLGTWSDSNNRFHLANVGALQDFARAVLDVTEIAGVLTVDPNNQSLYIRKLRGAGFWGDPDSAFYVDKTPGYFSLGSNLTWNPIEKELVVDGTIYAGAGVIGGFVIDTDNIRDAANSFGLSSVVSGGDDVRFWSGATFANRATAPFRVYESGAIVATSGTIGGFTLSATALTAGAGDTAVSVSTLYTSAFSIGDMTNGPSVSMRGTGLIYGLFAVNDTNQSVAQLYVLDFGTKSGQLVLKNSAGTNTFAVDGDTGTLLSSGALTLAAGSVITWGGDTNLYRSAANILRTDDTLSANLFSGDGSSLTALNASNISSGTIGNGFLPSAISVSSLTASGEIRGATARFGTFTGTADAPVNGWMDVTDAGGAARKLATVA